MEICKSKQIQNCCQPNAIITLKEYLQDYASKKTKQTGENLLKQELETIKNEKVKKTTVDILKKIEQGERDFRF